MADFFTNNGLSNGRVNQIESRINPTYSVSSGPSPAALLRANASKNSQVDILSYPLDLPKYFMSITISSYERQSLMQLGTGQTRSVLGLPLPDHLIDMNNVTYNKADFSGFVGNVLNSSIGAVSDGVKKAEAGNGNVFDTAQTVGQGLKNNASAIGGGLATDITSALTGQSGINAIKAATGYAPNYFLTVLLDGPQYKSFNFSWTLAPRSPQEAAQLTKILRTIKNAQAVGLSSSQAFFKFPRIFRCSFSPDRGNLYQFKPAILESFTVDYSGAGQAAMHQPRPESGDMAAPAVVKISATFTEMEFWLRSDFGDNNDLKDSVANDLFGKDGGGRSV
jgi:hypothetical protein